MDTTHAYSGVDAAGVAHPPGFRSATVLFDRGLWFEAVVRGLTKELGFTEEEATRAAVEAARARLR